MVDASDYAVEIEACLTGQSPMLASNYLTEMVSAFGDSSQLQVLKYFDDSQPDVYNWVAERLKLTDYRRPEFDYLGTSLPAASVKKLKKMGIAEFARHTAHNRASGREPGRYTKALLFWGRQAFGPAHEKELMLLYKEYWRIEKLYRKQGVSKRPDNRPLMSPPYRLARRRSPGHLIPR